MDFYGHRVGARLAEMEDGFNEKFPKDYPDALKLKLFEDFKKPTKAQPNYSRSKLRFLQQSKLRFLKRSEPRSFKRLKLRFLIWFKRFFKRLNNRWQYLNNSWHIHWRVRYAISVFALLAAVVWLLGLFDTTHNITSRNFSNLEADPSRMEIKLEPPVQVQTQSPQLQELKKELLELFDKKLDENLDSIRSLINTKNTATPTNNVGKPRQ